MWNRDVGGLLARRCSQLISLLSSFSLLVPFHFPSSRFSFFLVQLIFTRTDANRPKDEAERHKRTLESKRRWAAKNRAEKRAKRKGTTVEEELGLIEAAEAAEAAAAAAAAASDGKRRGRMASNAQDDEQDENSFSSAAGSSSGHGMRGNQSYHTHHAYAYRDPRAPALASLSSSHGHGHAAVSMHPLQHPEHMLVHAPPAYWHELGQCNRKIIIISSNIFLLLVWSISRSPSSKHQ
jgi:hypothetical protein